MNITTDIIIVGGGLVGAAAALSLARQGLSITLVESHTPQPLSESLQNDDWDSRIYAVTPGNTAFLKSLNVWDDTPPTRIAPIYEMHVQGDDGHSQLTFNAYDAGVPELGNIIESRALQHRLWQAILVDPSIQVFCPAICQTLETTEQNVTLTLQEGQTLHAKLIIGADGGNSWVRQQTNIQPQTHAYQQQGIVANFETERPHGNIARQWFLKDGILAWLPLPGNRISIVWSAFNDRAAELMAQDTDTFTATVAVAGQHALGNLRLITPAAAFPLQLQHSHRLINPRIALVGDAAHRVHPLAGHGVNLGFRDVRQLTDSLQHYASDLGGNRSLRHYERARKADILAMQAVTLGLQKLFNNSNPLLSRLRNAGLGFTHQLPFVKRQLMAYSLL